MSNETVQLSCYKQDTVAIGVLGIWLVLYVWGGATTFQPADSAEFLTVVANRGIAHPPGYPLYTMLGIFATWLWPGSVVQAMSWLAACITWGTVIGMYLALRLLTRHRWAAFWGACITGMSLHLWKHATHPEAFALLGFFAAWLCVSTVYALAPESSASQRRWAWFGYALCAGLASTHHHTIILTTPLGVLLLYRLFMAPSTRLSRPSLAFCGGIALFVIGLTPYLYLLWAGQTNTLGSWGSIQNIPQLWDHFLRKEFGTFQSGLYSAERPFWFHSWQYIRRFLHGHGTFPAGLFLFPLLGLLLFLLKMWGRPAPTTHPHHTTAVNHPWQREILWAWFGSWVLAGLVFPTQLKMGTSSLDQYVAARFFLLPDIFLGGFAGIAIHAIYQHATTLTPASSLEPVPVIQNHRTLSRRLSILLHITFLYWIGMGTVFQFDRGSSHRHNWLETYARDILQEMPTGALLLEANDEAMCFGIQYLQIVHRLRTDVRLVCLPLLSRRWYVQQLQQAWPEFSYHWNARHISSLALIAHYLRMKRPVHSTELYNQSIQSTFPWVPYGVTWHIWTSTTQPVPSPFTVEQHLLQRYRRVSRQQPLPHPETDPWPSRIVRRYATPWLTLASTYRNMRNMPAVRRCRQRARQWIP